MVCRGVGTGISSVGATPSGVSETKRADGPELNQVSPVQRPPGYRFGVDQRPVSAALVFEKVVTAFLDDAGVLVGNDQLIRGESDRLPGPAPDGDRSVTQVERKPGLVAV